MRPDQILGFGYLSTTEEARQSGLPEPCQCDRSGQLTWLWSREHVSWLRLGMEQQPPSVIKYVLTKGNLFVDRRLDQIIQSVHFYLHETLSCHSQSKKLQLGESLLVELVRGTPLLSSWTDGHRLLLNNTQSVEKCAGRG